MLIRRSIALLGLASVVATGACASREQSHERQPELISLLNRPLFALQDPGQVAELETKLADARRELSAAPDNPEKIVWVGRRLGYLWRMNEAVSVYSDGIQRFGDYAPLYRHRGHRFISLRQFDKAIADLERAAELMAGQPDEVEQDGMPNELNIPLTTTGFNVWYHLGLARYLQGDFEGALSAYIETLKHCGEHEDNFVATLDWLYMTYRRLGQEEPASALLQAVHGHMNIIENHSYHRRLLMYKGELQPDELLAPGEVSDLDVATQGYGVGNYQLCNGNTAGARETFERVVGSRYWPAFGFIAAEAELARQQGRAAAP